MILDGPGQDPYPLHKAKRLRYDKGFRYEILNHTICDVQPYAAGAKLLPFWSFLPTSKKTGVDTWRGVACDVWSGRDPQTNEQKAVCWSATPALRHMPLLYWRTKKNGDILSREYGIRTTDNVTASASRLSIWRLRTAMLCHRPSVAHGRYDSYDETIPSMSVFDVPAVCYPTAPPTAAPGAAYTPTVVGVIWAIVIIVPSVAGVLFYIRRRRQQRIAGELSKP
jgi:hypothetical protein